MSKAIVGLTEWLHRERQAEERLRFVRTRLDDAWLAATPEQRMEARRQFEGNLNNEPAGTTDIQERSDDR